MTVKPEQRFQRQLLAYKQLEIALERIQKLQQLANEHRGIWVDSKAIDDRIEIGDELRVIEAELMQATAEFKAACEAFDDLQRKDFPYTI